ncbi:MAG: hypothetical protein HY908_33225 [Myxococcales bacterium]|nr:hypothetical protein [Myxococcales bacterium]
MLNVSLSGASRGWGRWARRAAPLLLGALCSLSTAGCLKKLIFDGQVASTRKGADAVNTLSDYEVANVIAFAGLGQFEGMHFLGPYNEDALFMLVKGWAGAGFGFIEDKMEQAADAYGEDSELAEYHKARAIAAYDRATFYGVKLLEMQHPGFEAAKKGGIDGMRTWLAEFVDAEKDTPVLFWVGQAWLSKVNLLKDQPSQVAELFVGVALAERAVELDETYLYGSGHVVLGAYHARSGMAELDEAKKHFERASELNGGKALLGKFQYAAKYLCARPEKTPADKEEYVKLLTEVVEAGDTLPEQRLQNVIAKRKARRALGKARMDDCGF